MNEWNLLTRLAETDSYNWQGHMSSFRAPPAPVSRAFYKFYTLSLLINKQFRINKDTVPPISKKKLTYEIHSPPHSITRLILS